MSHPQFSGSASGMLIELDKNTSNIWGSGNLSYPYIGWQVPVFVSFHEKQSKQYAFRAATAQLQLNQRKIADARPLLMDRMIRPGQSRGNEYLNLEFPVDQRQICAMEDYRQGGSLKLQLWVQLHIDEYRPVLVMRTPVWELENCFVAQLQQDIEITQTHWVKQVLPQIGYGKIHIVEFPAAPLESCAALHHAFKALQQAQERHKIGLYDDAVSKCRIALEKFFDRETKTGDDGKTRDVPVPKKAWEMKLGKAACDWLATTLRNIKDAANPTAHSANGHYDQFESQMFLAITTAVVAYVARTIGTEAEK